MLPYKKTLLSSMLIFLPFSSNAQKIHAQAPHLPPAFLRLSGNMMVGAMNVSRRVPIVGDSMADMMQAHMQKLNAIPLIGPIHMEMMQAATLPPKP
jgi:hypothetical protein